MDRTALIDLAYLAAAILFIFAVKGLTHPRTAVRGNLFGALGMLVACVATLFHQEILDAGPVGFTVLGLGLAVGAVIGGVMALRVPMTAMPQLVALFNGFGGGASFLVAWGDLVVKAYATDSEGTPLGIATPVLIATAASGVIGTVTFTGSLVAFAKLQELISGRPIFLPLHQLWNALAGLATLALAVLCVVMPDHVLWWYFLVVVVGGTYGVVVLMPVGGADMPVMVAMLNSLSGLAAAAVGFVLNNNALIISGSLVGASGFILTQIMCKAMNRSLLDVMVGNIEQAKGGASADEVYAGKVKAASPEEVAMLFDTARKVIVVPGYGMAVAQAQHAVRDLANALDKRGVDVAYAIHPVAGRMPGHMNVLLAEADVPYEKLLEMQVVNPMFEQTDVVLVIGANDVVNPLANTDPGSPIAGMPILEAHKARTVVVVKRSLSPGFAGIPNPLFAADNTLMLFSDGQKAVLDIIRALEEG